MTPSFDKWVQCTINLPANVCVLEPARMWTLCTLAFMSDIKKRGSGNKKSSNGSFFNVF